MNGGYPFDDLGNGSPKRLRGHGPEGLFDEEVSFCPGRGEDQPCDVPLADCLVRSDPAYLITGRRVA